MVDEADREIKPLLTRSPTRLDFRT